MLLIQNSGMVCNSLLVLFSFGQYHVEYYLKKIRKIGMVHRQSVFERRKPNMFIDMDTVLDRRGSQIRFKL